MLALQRCLQTPYLCSFITDRKRLLNQRQQLTDPITHSRACILYVHRGEQVTNTHTHTHSGRIEGRPTHLVVHSVGHDRSRLLLLGIAEGSDPQGNLRHKECILFLLEFNQDRTITFPEIFVKKTTYVLNFAVMRGKNVIVRASKTNGVWVDAVVARGVIGHCVERTYYTCSELEESVVQERIWLHPPGAAYMWKYLCFLKGELFLILLFVYKLWNQVNNVLNNPNVEIIFEMLAHSMLDSKRWCRIWKMWTNKWTEMI